MAIAPTFSLIFAAPNAHAQTALDEIIVTVRKVEEPLQAAALAISVFSANDLDLREAIDLADIGSAAPNVTISPAGTIGGLSNAPAIFIRGVGQQDFTINSDPAVGIYVDGDYIGRSISNLLSLLDVERVEVLRGRSARNPVRPQHHRRRSYANKQATSI